MRAYDVHTSDGRIYYLPFPLKGIGKDWNLVWKVRVENYTDSDLPKWVLVPLPIWRLLERVQEYESDEGEDLCPVKAEVLCRWDILPDIWEIDWGGIYIYSFPERTIVVQ